MTIGGLGSGLDFLYDENATEVQVKKTLRVSELEPNRDQPRKQFSDEAIQTLADSIQQYGMIQPILVRPLGLNYQIVAGERRWRAARMLGMDEVPVVIRELTDEETMAVALIENLQREDLNPLEEANAYAQLMDMFHLTQEEVAKRVGKSRSAVANSLRLLKLPEDVKTLVEDGGLSAGHARALLGISDEKLLSETAAKAADGKLTVRAVEKIAADSEKPEKRTKFSHKGCCRTSHSPVKNQDKHQIQDYIDNRGNSHRPEGNTAVAIGTQQAGRNIVDQSAGNRQDKDHQIPSGHMDHIRLNAQQPHDMFRLPQKHCRYRDSKTNTDKNTIGHNAAKAFFVMIAYPDRAGNTEGIGTIPQKRIDQPAYPADTPHGCQGIHSDKFSNYHCVNDRI